ncbi:MAG TPA: EscU/YscU/HrcU family type III secretion system export apparatus switch protein [Chitinispirillaceae bacterium]|nr:EscU/YscU/HrcU family type III secretion system export apparatus switch protein [Chitinispirillaceae bacterium]
MKEKMVREKAVALKYNEGEDRAPKVVAKGQGHIADRIIETARQNGIPIYQDHDLLELLAQVDIDREIPSELYTAVAEILSWVYRANSEIRTLHS